MKSLTDVGLPEVQSVYSGPEGQLWELVMGQQIHIGGFLSSMDLAERAGIGAGMSGVDLCCCSGAGMRFLVRFRNVAGCAAWMPPRPLSNWAAAARRPKALTRMIALPSRWPMPATPACPPGCRFRLGRRRLVLRRRQDEIDPRGGPPDEAGRNHRLHGLDGRARRAFRR